MASIRRALPVSASVTNNERAFVRALARRKGVTTSTLIKLALRHYAATQDVDHALDHSHATLTPLATPQIKMQREDSGKSETIPTLLEMDRVRRANKPANKGFSDC